MVTVGVLDKKMWRTVRTNWGQYLAAAVVVALGVSSYISMTTAYHNLRAAKEAFYCQYDFADYYFHLVRAPQNLVNQIAQMPGVQKASGRVQKDLPLVNEGGQRSTVRLIGYPLPDKGEVNRLRLVSGRFFDEYPVGGGIEALVDPQYAAANRLSPGSVLRVVSEGRQYNLYVVGTATGPEFVYPMKDAASIMPEPEYFGIVIVPLNAAQQILNLPGQINQVVLKTAPGTDVEKLAVKVKEILEPYGNTASYPRSRQLSDAVLSGELDQLKALAGFLPPVFLGIAALIQFIAVGRMVRVQRTQIGVLKALGYSNSAVVLHYTGYALTVGLLGAAAGVAAGLAEAWGMSKAYAAFFNLPSDIGGFHLRTLATGALLALAVSALAGLVASRRAVLILPAESLRPESPRAAVRTFLESWGWLWSRLDSTWKMAVRAMGRNRLRTAVTVAGVVFASGMLIVALFAKDSIDYLVERYYSVEQRWDYLLRFAHPLKEEEIWSIARLEGVLLAEPVLELPVRIHFNGREREELLVGLPVNTALKRLFGEGGQPLAVPEEGIVVSHITAQKLGIAAGDEIEVETLLDIGPPRKNRVRVAGINRPVMGSAAACSLAQANRILGESRLASGAMLKVDRAFAPGLEEKLGEMSGISFIASRSRELENFNKNLAYMIYSILIMVAFAGSLGVAIVYSQSSVSFIERRRELALLRLIGFNPREVFGFLIKENAVLALLGVVLGLPFGRFLCGAYVGAVSTDLYTFKVVIYPSTYALSALLGVAFTLGAHCLAVRGLKKLEMVEVLKVHD